MNNLVRTVLFSFYKELKMKVKKKAKKKKWNGWEIYTKHRKNTLLLYVSCYFH